MKKFVALLLTLVLTFSLAACGAEGGVKDDEAAGPGSFKIGTLDTGSADATTAPLLNQLKLTVEALGCELVTATSTGMSAEETLVALHFAEKLLGFCAWMAVRRMTNSSCSSYQI